jgi:CubicO group peptidase (beta-lactamase class C family)
MFVAVFMRLLLPSVVLMVLSLAMSGTAAAQGTAAPTPRQIEARINAYMKAAVEVELFSGSILVARDGKPIVSRSYGLANIELDVPNTPQTVFRLASLSKQFTAAAIFMLQERDKLCVNDSVCKHLTECPDTWRPILIRHLLTMTHGIPGVAAVEVGPLRGLPVPWDQWMEATRKKPLDFAPGERFRYANSGYTLLGFIIEKTSGKSYGDFLQEEIFTPLGMKQTGYEDPRRIIKNRATGYTQLPGEPIANVPYSEIFRLYAAGGVYSTTEDLLLWDQALYTDRILSRASIDQMFAPFQEMRPGKSYASGWWVTRKSGRLEIAHGGNLAGFITYMARYPQERVSIIVLSNNGRGSAGKISDVLSSIVFGAPYEIPKPSVAISLEPLALDKFVGEYVYQHPPGRFVITKESDRLFAQRNAEAKTEMFAQSQTKFFLKAEDVQFTFVIGADQRAQSMVVEQGDGTLFEVLDARRSNQ